MSEQAPIPGGPAGPPGPLAEFGTGRDGAAQPLRMLGLAAVCVGVAALAAATFVLSYSGIHAVARQAGISPHYASDYPLLIDATLVIALLAVLALRGAGVPSRILAWLTLLGVLAAAAGADVLHATGRTLPYNVGATTAAVLPWALVLIAFLLLLALLRHARLRRQASAARRLAGPGRRAGRADAAEQVVARPAPLPVRIPRQWDTASLVPGFGSQLVSSAAAGAAAGTAAAASEPFTLAPEAGAPAGDQGTDDTDRWPDAAGDSASETGAAAEPPDHVGTQPANTLGQAGGADAEPGDTDAEPGDTDVELADAPAEPGHAYAEPGDTDAEPGDAPADDADAADVAGEPADEDELAAGDGGIETTAADDGDLATGGLAIRGLATTGHGTGDAMADDMPVFHRMWSTPTPPES
ncbi:MAG: DUF2637 domain-containing protein [Streptosporangiaceae bacterium]